MKKTLPALIFIIIALWACGGGESTVVLPPPPPDETPTTSRTIFVYDKSTPEIGTSDGEFYYPISQEKAANAGYGFISIGDVLHGIDDTGDSLITYRLPVAPDKIAIAGQDIWCFEIIPADVAGPQGALWKPYTKIYLNNSEYVTWRDNPYEIAKAIVTNQGDIITLDIGNKYRNVQDPSQVVNYASQDGISIHSIDATNHRANIGNTRVAFSTNYFFSAKQWVKAGNVYYSWNGYTWDGTTLTELSNKLSEFATLWYSERPVLIAAGSRTEHSESVTYWIECNTGWLYRHTPSIDALEQVIQLYQGGGTRNDGLAVRDGIKPVLTADDLFFDWNGTIWKYDFTTGIVNSFAAGVEIWKI